MPLCRLPHSQQVPSQQRSRFRHAHDGGAMALNGQHAVSMSQGVRCRFRALLPCSLKRPSLRRF
ncbi:hypothetical protein GW15_0200040 [Xanthomonas axonopodis pv. vasculorum]|uniref:Uncharacterized protein n=1 Tax=Xanthomonas axonopodis pv. vasculorum TaxID=325777 RepID=A0A098Q6V2_9XANT|nr:hypothetical protein GW15_0200040 [Xanthomonas axonopodis pv. vasculorum]PPV10304.1 hypothetical protein XavaCFBP5823_09610 [Xanthomonas axonopodis pv. vasculorum]